MAEKDLPRIVGYSVRPQETAALVEQTGLDETILARLVSVFYEHVRSDPGLGPIFEARIENWPAHLSRMVDFWSSVALMTGRYHGTPMQVHTGLLVDESHFEQWLALFRKVARQVCTPAGADYVIERAERIARSIHLGVSVHAGIPHKASRST
ncbi:group III truncated hemoglobin [Hyphomonas sp.]|uniref:group III truncated hemoglobin n=1 Tax=Hyphomonas sp. TaxID=87 RepID=UPI003529A408